MRNLKKLLAVIVAICVLATFTIPAFAEETTKTDADYVSALGVLKGDGNGVDATYLAKGTTRIQAAIIYLRLLGLENEALAFSSEENFDDAKDVNWAGGRNVLAYLKANPELGWLGVGGNKFGPNDPADAKMIYKVLLEGLGYKQGTDFEYSEVLTFAADKGLTKIADVEGQISNNDLATALMEGLKATLKDGSKTLAEDLVAKNAISKDAAIAAGLYSEKIVAKIVGAAIITVDFGRVVDTTKASFEVKNGTFVVPVDVTWNDAKTVATLKKTYGSFLAGTYTITEKGLTYSVEGGNVATLEVEAERLDKIEIIGESLTKTGSNTATISYKTYNQYGEETTKTQSISGVTSFGTVAASNGTATVTKGSGNWTDNDKAGSITLFNGTVTASKTVNLVSAKSLKAVTLGSAVLPKDTARFSGDMNNVKIEYSAVDQYGNDYTIQQSDIDNEDVQFVYGTGIKSGTARIIADPDDSSKKILVVDLETVTANTKATLTVIVRNTGSVSTTTIDLYPVADVADFTLTPDTAVVKVGTKYKVFIDAVDTYGSAIKYSDLAAKDDKFTISSTRNDIADVVGGDNFIASDSATKKSYIVVNPRAKGTTTLVITLKATGKSVTLPITVNEASNVVQMTLPVSSLNFAAGGSTTVKPTFYDQYNEKVTANTAYTVSVESSDATVVATQAGISIANAVTNGITIVPIGAAGKTATLTFKLIKTSDSSVIDARTVAVKIIDSAKTTLTYEVADISTLKGTDSDDDKYAAEIKVTAKDSSGNVVYIPASQIKSVTSANTNLVSVVTSAGAIKLYGKKAGVTSGNEATTTVTVIVENYDGTVSVANKTITVSKVDSYAASIDFVNADKASASEIAGSDIANYAFVEKDQYGVEINDYTYVVTNNETGATIAVDANGKITVTGTPAEGKSVNVTVITANGLLKTVKVTF